MKKIFTLFILAAAALTVNAQTRTTVWEGSKTMDSTWPAVQIAASQFSDARAGDQIIVTVSKADNSINSGWEWGPQVFIKLDWQDFLSAKYLTDGATDAEVAFDLSADDVDKIKAGQEIEIQGMNVIVAKCELLTAAETTSSTIWEGECAFGDWAAGFSIDAEKFADVSAGDAIVFNYTVTKNEEKNWYQFKTIFAGTDSETLTSNAGDLNEYGCASVTLDSKSFKITLNDEDVAKLKETGLYVNGKDITVTSVNLLKVVTGISNAAAKQEKTADAYYSLDGVKVASPQKGMYIHKGKKIVVK
ncbi:MAG: hypothetical protein IJ562_04965 [Prevotella sp.]|nr:hypothetical protein [Prevotella sp.]